jgi:hypothetical protein
MLRSLPAVFAVAALCGCTGADRENVAVLDGPIVGGTPVASKTSAVIYLGVGGSCTGTLIAPNLVLTAKHCVAQVIGASYTCDVNGNTFTDQDAAVVDVTPDAGAFGATKSPETFRVGPYGGDPTAPHVAQVLVAPGSTVCKTDVALLVLDRSVDNPTIAPVRLDHAPSLGEHLTATGWGITSGKNQATVLQQRDVTVLAVGPTPALTNDAGPANGAVPVNFFEVGEGVCHGDSGSPALASSGAVVGVASGVDNPSLGFPSGSATDCVAPNVRGIYEAVAAEKDFILSGYAAAHAVPWLEGQPDPRAKLKEFGTACANDNECKSNVCVPASDGGAQCSQGCLDATCPSGYQCAQISERRRCVPNVQADAGHDAVAPSSSCAVSQPSTGGGFTLLSFAVFCAARFRRRKVVSSL